MKGEWYDVLHCLHPDRQVPAWIAAQPSKCDLPEDDFPEAGDPTCPNCRGRHGCDDDAHGREYVGLSGHGFRTNRCPATWARSAFVAEVQRAYGWSEKAGGAFLAVYPRPSALLLDAVSFYSTEVSGRLQHEHAERMKDA